MLTNPIWVVKTRMFSSSAKDPTSYRGLWGASDWCCPGRATTLREASTLTLSLVPSCSHRRPALSLHDRGPARAVQGLSARARRRHQRQHPVRRVRRDQAPAVRPQARAHRGRRRHVADRGRDARASALSFSCRLPSLVRPADEMADAARLACRLQTNTEYILASGTSKGLAIAITYPYQVIRAKIQVRLCRTGFPARSRRCASR